MTILTQKQTRTELTNNYVKSINSYYESKDFKSNYEAFLLHDTSACIDRIYNIAKNSFDASLTRLQCSQILDYINTLPSNGRMYNYYVGENCIDSIEFGEQEEEIPTDFLPIMSILKDEFCINKGSKYMYIDFSGEGLKYDLTAELIIETFIN